MIDQYMSVSLHLLTGQKALLLYKRRLEYDGKLVSQSAG